MILHHKFVPYSWFKNLSMCRPVLSIPLSAGCWMTAVSDSRVKAAVWIDWLKVEYRRWASHWSWSRMMMNVFVGCSASSLWRQIHTLWPSSSLCRADRRRMKQGLQSVSCTLGHMLLPRLNYCMIIDVSSQSCSLYLHISADHFSFGIFNQYGTRWCRICAILQRVFSDYEFAEYPFLIFWKYII